MFSKIVKSPFSLRAVAIVAPAAILAVAVAVAPSFAGSFLTQDRAARTYVSKRQATDTYLRNGKASKIYLTKQKATGVYLKHKDSPFAAAGASTALFGPVSSTEPVDVPGSTVRFTMPSTGLVALTFSGVSSCTGDTGGVACPVKILVDGQAASTGASNFDLTHSSDADPAVHTLTQTTVATEGDHVASLQYAGAEDPTAEFGLTSWNLVVEGFPGS